MTVHILQCLQFYGKYPPPGQEGEFRSHNYYDYLDTAFVISRIYASLMPKRFLKSKQTLQI